MSFVCAAAHGVVTTPPPRVVRYSSLPLPLFPVKLNWTWLWIGAANLAACGSNVNTILKSDKYGPVHRERRENVSVVNLVTQTPIARLFTWAVYANDTLGPPDWPTIESASLLFFLLPLPFLLHFPTWTRINQHD
ncbi:hypothetical protein DFH09DRAFT_1341114 [Mycena vulgaris]|nr:hypothetical protein DFH09DRAFT_1341114 [Mycena vulgaris]